MYCNCIELNILKFFIVEIENTSTKYLIEIQVIDPTEVRISIKQKLIQYSRYRREVQYQMFHSPLSSLNQR